MNIEMLNITNDVEGVIANVAKDHYQQDINRDDANEKICKTLIKKKYLQPLEHATATFKITGISISASRQIPQTTTISYQPPTKNEQKQIIPKTIKEDEEAAEAFEAVMLISNRNYERLLYMGIPSDDAQYVLPTATKSTVVVTMNMLQFRHLIQEQGDNTANWEVKAVTDRISNILRAAVPSLFYDLNTC